MKNINTKHKSISILVLRSLSCWLVDNVRHLHSPCFWLFKPIISIYQCWQRILKKIHNVASNRLKEKGGECERERIRKRGLLQHVAVCRGRRKEWRRRSLQGKKERVEEAPSIIIIIIDVLSVIYTIQWSTAQQSCSAVYGNVNKAFL